MAVPIAVTKEDWKGLLETFVNVIAKIVYLIPASLQSKVAPNILKAQYESWSNQPLKELDLPELVSLYRRGLIVESDYVTRGKKHGYDLLPLRELIAATNTIPDLSILFELKRRGFISETEFDTKTSNLGYSDSDIAEIKPLEFLQPSVQDLITFLVREVFSPEIRNKLQLDLEYPTEATAEFKKLGVSEENSKNYWASHWRLPSVTLAFEMFHRTLIDKDTLEFILRASDILPSLREPIINAAYKPLTRVDVRRMHDFGVINREQTLKAYSDLGYSPANAELMVKWTEAYNEDVEIAKDSEEARQLTQSQVLRLYRKGFYDRTKTLAHLSLLGYSDEIANVLVLSQELEQQEEEQENIENAVTKQYEDGDITYDDAVGIIASTGIEGSALNVAVNRLGAKIPAKIPQATQGQLNRMLHQGIVEPSRYMSNLTRRGYPIQLAGDLLESYGVGATSDKPRPNGRLELTRLFNEEQFPYETWFEHMVMIGYNDREIEYFSRFLNEPIAEDEEEEQNGQ